MRLATPINLDRATASRPARTVPYRTGPMPSRPARARAPKQIFDNSPAVAARKKPTTPPTHRSARSASPSPTILPLAQPSATKATGRKKGAKSARVAPSVGEAPTEPLSKEERDLAVCQLKEEHGAAIAWKQVAELVGSGTDEKDIGVLKSIYSRFRAKWKQNGADGLTSLKGDVERAKLAREAVARLRSRTRVSPTAAQNGGGMRGAAAAAPSTSLRPCGRVLNVYLPAGVSAIKSIEV